MSSRQPLRLLTFSSLFPNAAQPVHGVFVENRLRHLIAGGAATAQVVAPVPWFPSANPRFGSWAAFAKAPRYEERRDLAIYHPRYPVIPKVGMTVAPLLMYLAVKPLVERLARENGGFDLIDAHYFYPDGVAAALLGRALDIPVVITARGTDLSLIPHYALPRRQILWAADRAAGLITVCAALKTPLVEMGVPSSKVRVLRNGVDLAQFHPADRDAARARLGLTGPTLLSVGWLIDRKGHDLIIRALPALPGVTLLIAGTGPLRQALEDLAQSLGVQDRVRFLGQVPHRELTGVYTAADALVLASSREGWANVLLESMACGTPVVASNVWGTSEAVTAPAAGVLMEDRTPEALAAAVKCLFAAPPDRADTRRYAEQFSWDATTQGQLDLFHEILGR